MRDNGRQRILFMAEGATMAHFVRPLALAEALDPDIYDIHFCARARFSRFLSHRRFTVGELDSMPGEHFLTNLAKGAPLFSADVLRPYVQEDRTIIQRIRPALIVGDMRQSLSISARLEHKPVAIMINAYWSP